MANGFIKSFKSPADVFIFFIKQSNSNFWLYIDYQNFNNLIIKNWYSLLMISKFLDLLDLAKRFT